jgi:hypothetical protein
MGNPIAETHEVTLVAKSMIRDGALPSAHKLKIYYDGGQIVRYQKILDDFMGSPEGIDYIEKYTPHNKLPSDIVEFIEPHINVIHSELLKFSQFLVNQHEKEREQLCKVYRDEAAEVKAQNDLLNCGLMDEISLLKAELKSKDDLIAEQKGQFAELKQKLLQEQSEKLMLLQALPKNDTKNEAQLESEVGRA